MFSMITRFVNVCMAETYECSLKVVEIVQWQAVSVKGYIKNRGEKQELKKNMKHSNSYKEWKGHAEKYDQLKDIQIWKETHETSLFDWRYI